MSGPDIAVRRNLLEPVGLPRGRRSPHLAARLRAGRDEQVDPGIVLRPGRVSRKAELGEYYIDFVPSLVNYSEYRYGVFDDTGVPLVGWGEDAYYNPVTIAQYGFILHALAARGHRREVEPTLRALIDWFERSKEPAGDVVLWRQRAANPRYGLAAGFVSAMAIGEAISLYLRAYQLFGDESLLATAQAAYRFLQVPFSEGGVRRSDAKGHLWFEEYPTEPPSFVLNGFIYTLFGLCDLLRVTGGRDVREDFEAGVDTLRANLHRFDTGYWSVYDLRERELVSEYYQRNVHLPQMEVLFALTGDPIFLRYADRWRRSLRPGSRAVAQVMMRVRPRWARLRRWVDRRTRRG